MLLRLTFWQKQEEKTIYASLRRFGLFTMCITCGAGHDFHDGDFSLHRIGYILDFMARRCGM